jgi:hypothetical protein
VWKPEGKRPLRRPRHRWEDNIKMDFQEVEGGGEQNAEALFVARKETGLDVNSDKTKYMFVSRDQNAGRCHNIKVDNISFEMVEQFRYLGTTLTNKNSIHE